MASTPPPPPPLPQNMSRMESGIPAGPRGPVPSGPTYTLAPPPLQLHVICLNVVNTITQLVIGAVVFSALCFTNQFAFSNSLTQHIYLCVIGYILLMTQAVLSFNPYTGWANNLKYPQKRTAHWVMQITGSIFAIVGSCIRIADANTNFQTAHGIVGFIAMILTSMSLVGGILNLFFQERMNTILLKTLHAVVGSITLVLAYISLCLAFDDVYRQVFDNINANLSIVLTLVALIGTLFVTFMNMIRRFNHKN